MAFVAYGDVPVQMKDTFVRKLLARLGVPADAAIDMLVGGSSAGVIAIPRIPGMSAGDVCRVAEEVLAEVRGPER